MFLVGAPSTNDEDSLQSRYTHHDIDQARYGHDVSNDHHNLCQTYYQNDFLYIHLSQEQYNDLSKVYNDDDFGNQKYEDGYTGYT